MRLYARQKLLLNLVSAAGGHLAATDFQKLLFLYSQRGRTEVPFRFVPYRFGCFSFQSYADRKNLVQQGVLEPDENGSWKITQKAKPYLESQNVRELRFFIEHTVPERGDALIARVYREFPYYASRSEVVERVIPDADERRQLLSAAPNPQARALMTIGYEGDSIDGYLGRLLRHNVCLLCDVRRNPLSRKSGFSKNQLAGYCDRVGIDYLHLPELGIPGRRRRDLKSQADYDALFDEYEREELPRASEAVQRLSQLLEQYGRIALTCFEKEPEMCHRHCVAEAMEKQSASCPAPVHL